MTQFADALVELSARAGLAVKLGVEKAASASRRRSHGSFRPSGQ
ncbi:MAG: hypothetical protein AAF311_12640 [Pseudomonadota bacterium]